MHTNQSFFESLNTEYTKYHNTALITNRFSYADFRQVMSQFEDVGLEIQELGKSVEGRAIYSYTLGHGPVKVLMWSQMHGNESTATRALIDMLGFFKSSGLYDEERAFILNQLTIKLVPMINPDGTDRFQRRNAQGIDINRDARALESPEGRILKKVVDDFKPDFAFNLHDQRRMYNIDGTEKPSSISFLAPAYNKGEEINDTREKSMQVIALMNEQLQTIIPNQIGRYDDAYTYRAFGDNIQSWGSSTILVEAGWMKEDMEKEGVRKLNFLLLMSALLGISNRHYQNYAVSDYESIPMNDDKMFDILIKCVLRNVNGFKGMIDIGVNRTEFAMPGTKNYYSTGKVEDLGDLSAHFGFDCINEPDLFFTPGKIYETTLSDLDEASKLDYLTLLSQGYLFIKSKELPKEAYYEMPVNLVKSDFTEQEAKIDFESHANFLLTDYQGAIKYIVLNGFLLTPGNTDEMVNGQVIR